VESEHPGTEINYFQGQQSLRKQPFCLRKKEGGTFKLKGGDTSMKSITVQLQYDERVLHEGREVESKLQEQLYGTGFEVVSVSHESSNEEKENTRVKADIDTSGAGGQTSPQNEEPPVKR
jgi:rRNA maturation endonuclease Nob1